MVLLVGSGVMLRTFQALRQVDPGYSRPREVETFRVSIPETQVGEAERVIRTEEAILRKIEALPGVSVAGMVDGLPMDRISNYPVYAEDHPVHDGSIPPIRRYKMLSPGYAAAIGNRLVAGRDLTWAETYEQAPVALVSENVAREWWQDPRAAIGKRIRATLNDDWREVIGVLEDIRDDGIDQRAPGMIYWPLWQKNVAEKLCRPRLPGPQRGIRDPDAPRRISRPSPGTGASRPECECQPSGGRHEDVGNGV